jgi:hypothetical protein
MSGRRESTRQFAPTCLTIALAACQASTSQVPRDASLDAPEDSSPRDGPLVLSRWPGSNATAPASLAQAFGPNISGLVYEPPAGAQSAILWAVQNEPSRVFRLAWNGSVFVTVETDGWSLGKSLHYPGGRGAPDSEGLTRTTWNGNELYVVAERDNDAKDVSRPSILRYELTGTTSELTATHEWNLASDLPPAEPNKSLEGIAWIPDAVLVAGSFYDEAKKAPYDPSLYPDHGTGLFFVGSEDNGLVYGYALDHSQGSYHRVATFGSGQGAVMDLAFDRETLALWAICDGACKNRMTLLELDSTTGRFGVRLVVPPPTTLSSTKNEGITMSPESECASGQKRFFWADDEESDGYAIRRDSIPCGHFW